MNLTSFLWGSLEVLDSSTSSLFKQRCAGLGALIGPHFHHRPLQSLPKVVLTPSLFPHLTQEQIEGTSEPFSHGIARYVPWHYETSSTQIHATLNGDSLHKGVPLKSLEGQNFSMVFDIRLVHDGLLLDLNLQSEAPSVIGFHYYFACTPQSFVTAHVHPSYREDTSWKPLPSTWTPNAPSHLYFCLNQEADFGFQPLADPSQPYYTLLLHHPSHLVHIEYTASDAETTSWQLYHPSKASFACLEPLSALDPRTPVAKHSHLQMKIKIT